MPKILLAEGDEKVAASLLGALRRTGWGVVTARDASLTVSVALRERPDVVVIDHAIHGGSGTATLERLRSLAHTALTPVIVITGSSRAEKRELQSAGAEECIERPADPDALCAAIERHLGPPTRVAEPPAGVIQRPERLAALEETGLLDSAPGEAYDRVTRLATRLLKAPTSMVSLVAADRQFFKSQIGVAEPWAARRGSRLSHSLCKWVVAGREALVVPDVREHPALRGNLAAREMGVVAYAGVPLSSSDRPVGSLCAMDSTPHHWTDDELATLRDLARITEAIITLERAGVGRTVRATGPALGHDQAPALLEASGMLAIAAANVLRRAELHPGDPAHGELLDVLERQGQSLVQWGGEESRSQPPAMRAA